MLFMERDKIGIDNNSILQALEEVGSSKGPILCDLDFFKLQYQLEERRSGRDKRPTFVGLLTISLEDDTLPAKERLKSTMQRLKEVLSASLRRGDIVAQWSVAQFIINLPGLNIEQINIALDRVHKKFIALENREGLILHRKVEKALPRA